MATSSPAASPDESAFEAELPSEAELQAKEEALTEMETLKDALAVVKQQREQLIRDEGELEQEMETLFMSMETAEERAAESLAHQGQEEIDLEELELQEVYKELASVRKRREEMHVTMAELETQSSRLYQEMEVVRRRLAGENPVADSPRPAADEAVLGSHHGEGVAAGRIRSGRPCGADFGGGANECAVPHFRLMCYCAGRSMLHGRGHQRCSILTYLLMSATAMAQSAGHAVNHKPCHEP